MLKWADALDQQQNVALAQITYGDGQPPETLMLSDVARMLRQAAAAMVVADVNDRPVDSPTRV
jgi:hypothetical protein